MNDNFANNRVGSVRFAHIGKSTKHDCYNNNNGSLHLLENQFSDSNSVIYYDHYDNDDDDDDDEYEEDDNNAAVESGNNTIHSVYNKIYNKRKHNINNYVKNDVIKLSNMHHY